jgi:hypothetical protein
MDPFRFCLAFGPLALYLLVLGIVNVRRRPLLVSGARDTAALGLGVAGLMIVGPLELLAPQSALDRFGPYAWLIVLVMYVLSLSLVIQLSQPRLTIYNVSPASLRPVLTAAIEALDSDARWAGNSLALPQLEVELHVDINASMHNITLAASGSDQNLAGWRQLAAALRARLPAIESRPNPWGVGLLAVAVAMIARLTSELAADPLAIAQGFFEMLHLD